MSTIGQYYYMLFHLYVNIVNVLVYIRMIEINTITITYQNDLSIVFLM